MPVAEMDKKEAILAMLHWTAETQVEYTPEGKRVGTASYERYEKYSKAKTVGEALVLGSKHEDLLNDFRKFIMKVTGGVQREKPLDAFEVSEASTETDKALAKFAKILHKDSSTPAGNGETKAKATSKDRSWMETTEMREKRLRAEKAAEEVLKQAEEVPVTDQQLLEVLRKWGFRKNSIRRSVLPNGKQWVESDTLGLMRNQAGVFSVSISTREYPAVNRLILRWLRDAAGGDGGVAAANFPFTSIHLNHGFAARRHRAEGQAAPTLIRALGDFTAGGRLRYWQEDDRAVAAVDRLPDGAAEELDVRAAPAVIDGCRAHEVEAFEGERFSLVFYTQEKFAKVPADVKEQLDNCGFSVPTQEAIDAACSRLPAAKGYAATDLKPIDESTESSVPVAQQKGKRNKKGVTKGAAPGKALKFSLLKKLQQPAKEAAGGQKEKATFRLASAKICRGGLLARVMASQSRKVVAANDPPTQMSPALKPETVIQGGLLARVMAKNGLICKSEGEESSKDVAKKGEASPKEVAKKGAKQASPLTLDKILGAKRSGGDEADDQATTTATPTKKRKVGDTEDTSGALPSAPSTKKEPAVPRDQHGLPDKSSELAGCGHLLALVNVLSLAEMDPAAAVSLLAGYFQRIAQAAEKSEEVIRHVARLLEPAAPVPPEALKAAVTEAFGVQATEGVGDDEGLARAAEEGRRQAAGAAAEKKPRLLLEDAAQIVGDKEHQPAQLGKLLTASRAEAGETRWLVRLLQGRSGLAHGTVHSALARALVSSML